MELLLSVAALARDASSTETITGFISSVLCIIGMWKIFVKAGEPGWAAIVPFYNLYVLYKITWGSGWRFLLLLIPIANIVFAIITCVKLARCFGRGGGFAVGLVLLAPVFYMILGFGDAAYIGPNGFSTTPPSGEAWDCECGAVVQGSYCPNCGKHRPEASAKAKHFCPNCGAVLEEGKRFCPSCGNAVE